MVLIVSRSRNHSSIYLNMASIAHSSDLLVEILKRLPPKSIGRFRCVSKPWNSLLSSSFFIALHYNFTVANTPINQKSYFLTDYGMGLQQCVVYQPQEHQRGGGFRERAFFLDLPYSTVDTLQNEFECVCFQISGVIHGVVCLTTTYNAVVWNPTIRKHISLDLRVVDGNPNAFIGFGFDAAKSDFKVVVVPCEGPCYKIYSVQDGFWRSKLFPLPGILHRFRSFPLDIMLHRPGCFINGHIYWLAPSKQESGTCDCLLMFDCEREEFKTKALPPELAKDELVGCWQHRWSLFKHGGMLSLLYLPNWERYDLWVMEGDEDCGTWRKVLTLPTDGFSTLFGKNVNNIRNPRRRIQLSSKDIPVRLDTFNQQPLTSQEFHKSLYLMDVKNPRPVYNRQLTCYDCRSPARLVAYKKTLFHSRLL